MDNIHETQKPSGPATTAPISEPQKPQHLRLNRLVRSLGAASEPFVRTSGGQTQPFIKPDADPQSNVQSILGAFDAAWSSAQRDSEKRLRSLSPAARPLVEAQIVVNRLSLGAQLISQTAEAVGSTVRRAQQLGGN